MKNSNGLTLWLLFLCSLLCACVPAEYRVPCVAFTAALLWRRISFRSARNTLPGGQRTVGGHFLKDDEVAGMLFDCDGTLLDTMPLFFHSWEEVSPTFGLKIVTRVGFEPTCSYPCKPEPSPQSAPRLAQRVYGSSSCGFC